MDKVTVSPNNEGEATSGTQKRGSNNELKNTDSVPQNAAKEIKTTEPENPVAKRADEYRNKDKEGVKFANESNPNQKGRKSGVQDKDQDGRPRTEGISAGVAADDTYGTVPNKENEAGEVREESAKKGVVTNRTDTYNPSNLNNVTNIDEMSEEDQFSLEDRLSDPGNGIQARVATSTGNYVEIYWFYNNLPLGSYESRDFNEGDAKKFLGDLKKRSGL